uniref:uracil phosphoribosyltransferase or UMP pyrophosphorylase n=1 Tax=Synarthrophyton patena TaxID=48972 RepID=UPI00218219A9|nr:uracil phosphoribosyltransferase or UMP pyrophosphorylase [Synarthrophyton patena]UVF62851.1 uracil phosphoribosyltransferase or UMP pyrophosphorylase [Synarthrophyton patena]
MKLNIYTISHPITQLLSNNIQNTKQEDSIYNQSLNQIGLFLLYETIRDWIKIYKLTVKQIYTTKEFLIHDSKESYIVMTNITINLEIIQKAKYILPNCNISLINFKKCQNSVFTDLNFSYIPKQIHPLTKIIIISHFINAKHIIKLMDYLTKIKNIKIYQVRLISIICESNKLITISKIYPKLNIYTTKIKNDP